MAPSNSVSRRSVVLGGLGLAVSPGGLLLAEPRFPIFRESTGHRVGPPTRDRPAPDTLATLISYLGAFFGQDLSAEDHKELTSRLTFAATRDSGWANEYKDGSELLDHLAAGYGQDAYATADRESQVAVIRDLRKPLRGPLARVRLAASESVRARERMRRSTSIHLIRLYRQSGVPWRQRGFSTWPGAPDQVSAFERLKNG